MSWPATPSTVKLALTVLPNNVTVSAHSGTIMLEKNKEQSSDPYIIDPVYPRDQVYVEVVHVDHEPVD